MGELTLGPHRVAVPAGGEQRRAQRNDDRERKHAIDVERLDVLDSGEELIRHGECHGEHAQDDAEHDDPCQVDTRAVF